MFLVVVVALAVMIVGLFIYNGVTGAFESRDDDIHNLTKEVKKRARNIRLFERARQN